MNKPFFFSAMLLLSGSLVGLPVQLNAQDEDLSDVKSLRGNILLDEESDAPSLKRWQPDRDPIPRDYVQQPPLIPHKVDGYVVNLKSNKCLSCHSWSNYKESGATKISQSHFADRDENEMANVAPRRYFCSQCHVPQVNAKPLIENTFEPVMAIKQH